MPEDDAWVPPGPPAAEAAVGLLAGVAGRAAAPLARAALHSGLQQLFRGGDDADLPAPAPAGDAGWFGPDSVTWRVHADTAMYVGGVAALVFQALHPLAMAGVSDHSDYRVEPLARLRRTAAFVGVTAYGTSADASRMCETVSNVHARVEGRAPDGRPYSARDPELLDWVHTAEFSAFAAAHRRFGADPTTDAELDRYVAEVTRIGTALGDPSPPASWEEVNDHLALHRPNLSVNEQTRSAWQFLESAHSVLPTAARPAYRLLFKGAIACLPPWARRLWGVGEPSTVELAACHALVRGLGALIGETPRLVEARARVARSSGDEAQRNARTASSVSASGAPLSSR